MLNPSGNNTNDIRILFENLNALVNATNQKQKFGTFGTDFHIRRDSVFSSTVHSK